MITQPELLTREFRALSARLGQDPLQVQGPGGNTSVKSGKVMWIKASGTELANAETQDIFVPVDRKAAVAEAREISGDGSCKTTVIDPAITLRPSIETTFHAALDYKVVVHTHSVATITHSISPQGRAAAVEKLNGLPFVQVPYAKPGLPLTREILSRIHADTRIVVLQNHGLIVCGDSVQDVSDLLAEVEERLTLPAKPVAMNVPDTPAPSGFEWVSQEGWMALVPELSALVRQGTYYPDHVVFLGPGLPTEDHDGNRPALIRDGVGIAMRDGATSSQAAMLRCLSDVFSRLPDGWSVEAIGQDAEAELLDWDAEKYRQALAARA